MLPLAPARKRSDGVGASSVLAPREAEEYLKGPGGAEIRKPGAVTICEAVTGVLSARTGAGWSGVGCWRRCESPPKYTTER